MAEYIPLPEEARHLRLNPVVDVKIDVEAVYAYANSEEMQKLDEAFKKQMKENKRVPVETLKQFVGRGKERAAA